MNKSIIYLLVLITGLALSLGVVCASENTLETPLAVESCTADVEINNDVLSATPDDIENQVNMPEMNIKAPKAPDIDISGPKVDIEVPDVDIKGPKAPYDVKYPGESKVPEVKVKGPMVQMYGIDGELLGEQHVEQQQQESQVQAPPLTTYYNINGGLLNQQEKHIEQQQQSPGPGTSYYNYDGDLLGEQHVEQQQQQQVKFSMPGFKGEGPEVDVNLPKASMPTTEFYGYDLLTQQQQQQQQQILPHSLIIDKYWEGNDSGDITYVEIELFKQVLYQEHQEQQQSESDELGENEGVEPQIIQITAPDGVLRDYIFVGKYNITKENNWRLTINDLYYQAAGYYHNNGESGWYLSNFYEYLVREVNLPENVINISASYVSYNATSDFMSVYWNLTNRYIPSNDTNETEENVTEEPPINSTVENVTLKEVPVNDEIVNITTTAEDTNITVETNETEEVSKDVQKASDVKNATGNPLVLLLMVIALIGVPVLRRKD